MYKSIVCCVLLLVALGTSSLRAQTQPDSRGAKFQQQLRQTADKGVAYLLEKGRDETDGSFSKQLSPAVTGLCISALVRNGVPVGNKKVQQSLAFLETMVQPDGGIYGKGSHLRNYETSVSVIAFHQCNVDGKYDEILDRASKFLKGIQWDDGEGHGIESNHHGGQGYGSHERPDLSNTSFFLDALKELEDDDMQNSDAVRKALIFTSRCQNLASPYNSAEFTEHIPEGDEGSFIYSAVGKGETKVEPNSTTPAGGLRGYASMTYAGLKTFLYAGVDKDDFRVKAAMDWISRHYDLDSNPGMGKQGLFYYYHVFAKTMNAIGDPKLKDHEGVEHDWRSDLVSKLASMQKSDGSWTNEHDRWYEGDPNLVTAYSLLAISYCQDSPNQKQDAVSETESEKSLRHVVMFAFNDDASKEQIAEVESAFAALPEKIDTITGFEWGTNNSPEGLNDGLTHCFLVTFDSEAGRAEYLPHPAHKAFVDILKPILKKAVVIDYWTKD
ncbi:Dabb family protein [Mariniblastus fucicola]|nr:Dabb family protein [Mariniblastus fucicola]